MSFDGIVTRAVTNDLKEQLLTGRIVKIHQPYKTDLIITIRVRGRNQSLFISANPSFARLHITKEKFENPQEPPMFCMLLRKHLEGSIVENIEQKGLERIVTFSFKGKNELGDVSYKTLIVEFMGRHSNILFVNRDDNKIIDSIKHIPPSLSSFRTVLPGQLYKEPPHQDKLNPLEVTEEDLLKKLDFNKGKMDQQLLNTFSGLSPQVIKEILFRAKLTNRETLPKAFLETLAPVKEHHYWPQMIVSDLGEAFSVVDLTHKKGNITVFDSVHELLDRYYSGKAERDRVKQQANDLEKFLRNEFNKNKKKIKKLEKTLSDADKAQREQRYGELLTAHMHLIKAGDKEVTVTDYYDPEQGSVTIPLDPQKSPSENAQHYFRRYQKLKKSVVVVKEQIEHAKGELDYLEQLIQQVETASPRDIEGIREELAEEGYIKRRAQKNQKKKKNDKPVLEQYISSEGIDILVGKNNKQNEYLTNRFARQNDTWLHTKDIPGSHVVIRAGVDEFGEATLLEAANLAAYFSKGRQSGQVPVDYTLIRHVKKPSGAKPGYVIYDNQTTLYVTPDEDLVRKLRK
ncbi:putative ribosome quality control (RQC) complex YloA/Tae2 family protein [Evansella vedderi]|uniref:Rqc2 homolog RqcH n=1 Tax=Evansella vedderi TaxID=38282 RepID=A0ABT9ZSS1_9BACI|nr:NFACT RNA binding domain-containing protein [Evansella vedderi]MDQ0253781.1 putative ribosome quality control (RQC) complex YloA/Tae2 family protein [Evansella vedderi]